MSAEYQLGLTDGYNLGRKGTAEADAMFREMLVQRGEGDWQLPPPDDDHAGED